MNAARMGVALGLLLTALCLAPTSGWALDLTRTVGDAWTLETHYLSRQAGGSSEAVFWRYEVVATESADGEELYVVRVGEQGREPVGTIRYRAKDHSVASVEYAMRAGAAGQQVTSRRDYADPTCVATGLAPFPIDAPVFPLDAGSESSYATPRKVGDMQVMEQIRQVTLAAQADRFPEISVPAGSLQVACVADPDRPVFVQVWSPGQPGPVYGENLSMYYSLVGGE